MMANSSRDPYWQAGVRRETIDHPSRGRDIEDECSICHMPMARSDGACERPQRRGVRAPAGDRARRQDDRLAHDGVSCTLCHQISSDKLGTRESFVGGFVIAGEAAGRTRPIFGPFEVDKGLTTRHATRRRSSSRPKARTSGSPSCARPATR